MPLPKELYRRTSQAQKIHTDDASSGEIDFERVLSNEPECFIAYEDTEVDKPAKFILAPWNARNWEEEYIDQVLPLLGKLIDEGIEIYVWRSYSEFFDLAGSKTITLKRLTKERLEKLRDYSVRMYMHPGHPEKMFTEACKRIPQTTRDELFILCDYWLDYLLNPNNLPLKRRIRLSDFRIFSSYGSEKKQLLSYFSHCQPVIEEVLFDEISLAALVDLKKLQLALPKAALLPLPAIQKLDTSFSLMSAELANKPDQVLEIHKTCLELLRTLPLSETNLRKLKQINIGSRFNKQRKPPARPSNHFFERIMSAAHLIKAEDLKAILSATSELEFLTLSGCPNIANSLVSLPKNSLAKLKQFSVSHCSLTFPDLLALWQVAPHIEWLTFSGINIANLISSLPETSIFLDLKGLDLGYSDVTESDLVALQHRAPNLESLKEVNTRIFKTNMRFPHLKSVSLAPKDPAESLDPTTLFDNLPELKELDLRYFYYRFQSAPKQQQTASFFALLSPQQLSCLESVSLGTYPPDSLDLQIKEQMYLLINANNLNSIDFFYCRDVELLVDSLDENLRLPNLKKINLGNSKDWTSERIEKLKKIAPNISPGHLDWYLKRSTEEQKEEKGELQSEPTLSAHSGDQGGKGDSKEEEKEVKASAVEAPKNNIKRNMDADTRWDPKKEFTIRRIFYAPFGINPGVMHYRQEVYRDLELNPRPCTEKDAFCTHNQDEDPDWVPCLSILSKEDLFPKAKSLFWSRLTSSKNQNTPFFGSQKFQLDEEWQAIASLSAHETMIYHRCEPADADIELNYSMRENLYYIRSKKGQQKIRFDFVIEVPKNMPAWPAAINNLVKEINSYGIGDLHYDLPADQRTGETYLNAILSQKRGACRHRTMAFKKRMEKEHPHILTRVLFSGCHAWAEVYFQGKWLRCDFGGYPAKLNVIESKRYEKAAAKTEQKKTEPPKPVDKGESKKTKTSVEKPKLEKPNKYVAYLQPWRNGEKPDKSLNPLAYKMDMLKPDPKNKKRLIKVGSDEAADAMILGLQKQCKSTHRPVFCIHSPSEVFCTKPFIQRVGDKGIVHTERGGSLHNFLTAFYKKDNPPIILIKYNFPPAKVVGMHAWLDPERSADGTPIPENAIIIGVMNVNGPNAYKGIDFTSRFDSIDAQWVEKTLENFIPNLPVRTKEEMGSALPSKGKGDKKGRDKAIIDLFHASDWKSQLMGRLIMTKDGLRFEEGLLKEAIATKRPVEIQNGLWGDPEFVLFWQQACLLGEVSHQGQSLVTKNLSIVKSEGYNWPGLEKGLVISPGSYCFGDTILNPSRLPQFFGGYDYHSELQTLVKSEGLIKKKKAAAHKALSVYLTRPLSEDAWARLLTSCVAEEISLQVKLAPGTGLPKGLLGLARREAPPLPPPVPWDSEAKGEPHRQIIQSTDPDTTIAALLAKDPGWSVIDVSECRPSDLLIETRPDKESKEPFKFKQRECALAKALRKGKKIILTGHISMELADALAPILLEQAGSDEQKHCGLKAKFKVVTENTDELRYAASPISSHQVRPEDKRLFLKESTPITDEPLSLIKAREQFPEGSQGLYHLSFNKEDLGEWDAETLQSSLQKTQDFNNARNRLLEEVLFHREHPSPCVFITGLSGVGKSTFIEKELKRPGGQEHTLYRGESDMEAWARDNDPKDPKTKYLFIDEANLSPRLWTEMEGLFHNNPPKILIHGKLHTLTERHKVIFAGNPLNYGDNRKIAPFFLRHPCTVAFHLLSFAVVYEKILKPIFAKAQEEKKDWHWDQENLSKPFLEIYAFLAEQSTTDVLISPRELQMMAMLTVSYCKQMERAGQVVDRLAVAKHYAYKIARPLIPSDKLDLFEEQFGTEAQASVIPPLPLPLEAINKNPHFRVSASRLPLLHTLNELLLLREERRQPGNNMAQKFGGLGGLIFEGDSSVGKTVMVMALLRALAFEEVHDFDRPCTKTRPFCRLDPNKNPEEKGAFLTNAFYAGAVVVIDEMNTAGSMERLLNDLLMGVVPKEHQRPNPTIVPGFMVIGTQNPASMPGRSLQSTAGARRVLKRQVDTYPSEELLEIIHDGRPESYSQAKKEEFKLVVEAFQKNVALAKKNHYDPPTLRHLFRIIDAIKAGKKFAAIKEKTNTKQKAVTQGHSCAYFAFRVLEAMVLLGAVALAVSTLILSWGSIGFIAAGVMGGSVLLAEAVRFFKNKCCSSKEPIIPDEQFSLEFA